MKIEIIIKLFVAGIVSYIIFVMTSTLNSTFGIFSAIGFVLKAGHRVLTGEAIFEPRFIMHLFGLSIISGLAGTVFFKFLLPAFLRGDWVTSVFLLLTVVVIVFNWKERFEDEWNRRGKIP